MSTTSAASTKATELVSGFSTCELSDAILKIQQKAKTPITGGHIPDIRMLSGGRKICGPAYTVNMVLGSDTSAPKPDEHFVDAAPTGSVIVINAPPKVKNAVWGGIMTSGAIARGALGVVIAGRCRDIQEHQTENFPVFARGQSTLGQSPFTRPSELAKAVTIDCGDEWTVHVRSGEDIIVADEDGVVAVPVSDAEEVARLATLGREADQNCLPHIQAGEGVAHSFKHFRKPNAELPAAQEPSETKDP